MEVKITKTREILNSLEKSIIKKEPFSLIRFGDGTIKAMHAYLTNDYAQMLKIADQEGIPLVVFKKIIEYWKISANISDFIDTPEVYFSGKFWPRTKGSNKKYMSKKTLKRLKMWDKIYEKTGITNVNYCNPEINFLSCLDIYKKSLPDLIKDKKVCIISARDDLDKLNSYFDLKILKIVGKFENQYYYSFQKIIQEIDKTANDYDIWLVAAGELGRAYTGLIKSVGGRAFDIGSTLDVWCEGNIPSRLKPYLKKSDNNFFKFSLTENGNYYKGYF